MELMMTPKQIKLVQESFAKVAPISETAAALFYNRLFEMAPQVKAMFPADMTEQRKKLMATLEEGLGDGWTPELADAWTAAYGTLSGFMISEAYGRSQAAE